MIRTLIAAGLSICLVGAAAAQTSQQGFVTGPVFDDYGAAAQIENNFSVSPDMDFKVAFDISEASEDGKLNRAFDTVARFVNMHAAAGIRRDRIQPVIVVHGPASADLLQPQDGDLSETGKLVTALLAEGIPIYLCGQTAAARDIAREDLISGVGVALSAMTAHAVLASEGYSLNPF